METIQFAAPVDNNNNEWKKKKNYGPAVLVTVLLLGLAFLAGHYSLASYRRTAPIRSVSAMGGLLTVGEKGYPDVQLKNDTPYAVAPPDPSEVSKGWGNAWVAYGPRSCSDDDVSKGIAPGDTWIATSHGLCTVTTMHAWLTLPDGSQLECTHYHSAPGTSYTTFFVTMGGVDGCCVLNSQQDPVCS